ncbi:MAG: hypothetical protein GYB33_22345 [Gammaproteobacteria bacterium]|nr:hypothetical protein [Gammaproteobacteria bacterium]
MTVNAWEPTATATAKEATIDADVLAECIRLSREDKLMRLGAETSAEWQAEQRPLMTLGKAAWTEAASHLDNEEIVHLVRFFTLAEMQLEGWQAGAESPVVWLVKVLRKRKAPPSKELLLWIRANSDNRFLPNGAL